MDGERELRPRTGLSHCLKMKKIILLLILAAGTVWAADSSHLLNVSYDVAREFYSDYNTEFAMYWKEKTGQEVVVDQSHGGSSKQARAVLDGLEADVVTMNQDTDINILAKNGLVPENWRTLFPNKSAPYSSTIVFLVRKGNPKGIKDWSDLIKPGVSVIIPNPKTSGNGRYSYLGAWAYGIKKSGDDERKAQEFVAALFKNVPVLETGGRAATNAFVQREIGDVLLTFESETLQISRVFSPDKYDIVIPSISVSADAPVAVVTKYASKHGTTELARNYLEYLWSDAGQKLAVKYYLRPQSEKLLEENRALFPAVDLVTVDGGFGGWEKAQATHFADGGLFDQLYKPTGANP